MKRIGFITIGQSPRTDITLEIRDILGENIEILEKGALDDICEKEMEDLRPEKGEKMLVSRLRNGNYVKMSERKIIPLIEERIKEAGDEGAGLAVILCTGNFPELKSDISVIYPQRLLYKLVPLFTRGKCIAAVNPDEGQSLQSINNWQGAFEKVLPISCNPYDKSSNIKEAAVKIRKSDAEAVVLDCMGYTKKMKEEFEKLTERPVILPRLLLASILSEL